MSRGTRVIPVRIPADLLEAMDTFRESRNLRSQEEPWTRTAMILAALRELLSHRKRRPKRRSTSPGKLTQAERSQTDASS